MIKYIITCWVNTLFLFWLTFFWPILQVRWEKSDFTNTKQIYKSHTLNYTCTHLYFYKIISHTIEQVVSFISKQKLLKSNYFCTSYVKCKISIWFSCLHAMWLASDVKWLTWPVCRWELSSLKPCTLHHTCTHTYYCVVIAYDIE